MTLDNNTETVESQGEASGDDNSTIKTLRAKIKELEKRPDRDTLAAELRSEWERDKQIESALMGFGHPAGILDTVKGKLGDADVTRDSVAEALTAIGYQVEVADGDGESETPAAPAQADNPLQTVSELSTAVRSAAEGAGQKSVLDKINSASSREELRAIAEAELSV